MTKYSPSLANQICRAIATGSSLVKVCKRLKIDYSNVFEWLNKYPEFSHNYSRAREDQADFHADEIIEISDTEMDANKARVRIDARKWVAGKMQPKKYGDKQIHSGDTDNPIKTETTIEIIHIKP